MKLYIKYMVSTRCKIAVKEELNKLGLHFSAVNLGEVEIIGNLCEEKRQQLQISLLELGLELMDDRRTILIEKIKNIIIDEVHIAEERGPAKISDFLSKKLNHNYIYISNLFSKIQGITIEKYLILLKIERVKELLTYGELNISQIAWKMNYSSVAHLCSQFKKITGLTPSDFKLLKDKRRRPIEEIGNSNAA